MYAASDNCMFWNKDHDFDITTVRPKLSRELGKRQANPLAPSPTSPVIPELSPPTSLFFTSPFSCIFFSNAFTAAIEPRPVPHLLSIEPTRVKKIRVNPCPHVVRQTNVPAPCPSESRTRQQVTFEISPEYVVASMSEA
jgi:hypothetical protein